MTRMLVVGGGAAGMSAASVAKRNDPELEVTVAEAGGAISYAACGMPYWVAGLVEGDRDSLVVLSPEDARQKRGLDVRIQTRATSVDHAVRTATLEGPDGVDDVSYDHLVLAPGTEPWVPFDVPDGAPVFALRHLDDGVEVKRFVDGNAPKTAVVVGGGFVGLEMAEALLERGLRVVFVHSGATLMSGVLDEDLGEDLNQRVEQEEDVTLVTGSRVDSVAGDADGVTVDAGGESFDADAAILGLGAAPRTELAQAVGAAVGDSGAIAVDDRMRTGVDKVWACGDAVEFPHKVTGERVFLPLALHANRSGRIVGENVTGGDAVFPGVLGTTITRFFDMELAVTGLGEDAARDAGFDPAAATIKSGSKAIYFPGSQKLKAKIILDRDSGRVLGAQILGGEQTAKRIDTMSAAIWQEATAADVEAFDLAYAPPFNPVWDPWAIAARMADRER